MTVTDEAVAPAFNDGTGAPEAPTEAPAAETEAKTRRGRPRPQTTIDRDAQVLGVITAEGATKDEIVEATGLPKEQVYGSLWRLKRDGKIGRVRERGAHVWKPIS